MIKLNVLATRKLKTIKKLLVIGLELVKLKILALRLENDLRRNRTYKHDLIVLDDLFPHPFSAFRTAEYSAYLLHFPKSVVHCSGAALGYIKESESIDVIIKKFEDKYQNLFSRIVPFQQFSRLDSRLGYVMFLHNAYAFLDTLERNRLPFIFQLYPGGNFRLHDEDSDYKLARVCRSPCLKHIIVTQNLTYNYLLDKGFCKAEQVTLIYGVVLSLNELLDLSIDRALYNISKSTLDICFVSGKYMPVGKDKGYDVFIAAVKQLVLKFPDLRMHVVGPYDASDVPVLEIADRITFYGTQPTHFFSAFYACMDAIVSPNRSFMLAEGAFDGFPTGCCVEAGACGTAIFCTDDLGQNIVFEDKKDIVLIKCEPEDIVEKLSDYFLHYDKLISLGQRTRQTIQNVFSTESQIAFRIKIIEDALEF